MEVWHQILHVLTELLIGTEGHQGAPKRDAEKCVCTCKKEYGEE